MKTTSAICAFLATTVSAHMQMSNPYPIRSPLNPNGDESLKDYSYTSPLDASGSNYPCKGYQNDAFKSVATYTAGSEYSMSLAGSATHGGGSCQLSLSYDTAKTFTVIQSMEGGCPLTSTYNFTVPSDAPSGNALLVWTWFNKIGNREMYMNCAQVTVEGSSSKRSHARDLMVSRADTAFTSRPPIFVANVDGPGGCTTTAEEEVNFPEPGPDVVGGVSGTGYTCTGSADFLGDGSSSSSSGSSTSGSSSAAAGSSATSSPSTTTSTSKASSFPAASSSSDPTTSTTSSSSEVVTTTSTVPTVASSTVPDVVSTGTSSSTQACTSDGSIVCGADGTTWSMCDQGFLVSMGGVASGTTCANGAISRKK